MLSMTHSTESKEKKEIWGEEGADSGLGPSGGPLYHGGSTLLRTHACPTGTNWRASSLLEAISGHPLRCWAPASQWAPDPGTYH